MNRIISLLTLAAVLLLSSCSDQAPDFANSIPDDAVAVMTVHPMQLHSKGKINSFESLKEKVEDEVYHMLIEDPLSSGIMLNEYCYFFAGMEEEAPVIGMVAGMRNQEKFETVLGRIGDDISSQFQDGEGYTWVQPDEEGIVAWNDERIIILGSPDENEFESEFWASKLDWMFNPVKEESLASMVDFKGFESGMKDINLWLSSARIGEIVERFAGDEINGIPFNLENNYSHMYCEFVNGAVNISGKTNLSEEVQKNLDEVLVLKPSLDKDMLGMAPGGNLLLAFSAAAELEKIRNLAEKLPDGVELGDVGNQVEATTGIAVETWLSALTGDITLSVNGLEGDEMIPVEVFIGLGVNSSEIQDQLVEGMQDWVTPEKEGDFFIVNIQGNEIYSGILNDTWVLTNAKGYKDRLQSGSVDKSLLDSPFKEFAGGSMGLYMNLDLNSYPGMVNDLLESNPEQKSMVESLSDPFESLGMSAGKQGGKFILQTSKASENSLYTLLKLLDSKAGE